MYKKRYIECICDSSEHVMRMVFDKENKECHIEMQLYGQTFFNRVWGAIKYIFGYECKYGHWDCTSLSKDSLTNMITEMITFHNLCYVHDTGGKRKIRKALSDIKKGKPNSAFTTKKKKKKTS